MRAKEQLGTLLGSIGPEAAATLRAAIMDGRITGDGYWDETSGVGCILGTAEHARGAEDPARAACHYSAPSTSFALEDFAGPIEQGDEPGIHAFGGSGPFRAAMLVQWIDEWEAERVSA